MSKTIDEKIVAKVALLARISVPAAERARLAAELAPILDWIGQLDEVDVSGVTPLSHPMKLAPAMRDDIPAEPIPIEHVLKNAPESQSGFFVTPKTNE